jgi:hypothetical protein
VLVQAVGLSFITTEWRLKTISTFDMEYEVAMDFDVEEDPFNVEEVFL